MGEPLVGRVAKYLPPWGEFLRLGRSKGEALRVLSLVYLVIAPALMGAAKCC